MGHACAFAQIPPPKAVIECKRCHSLGKGGCSFFSPAPMSSCVSSNVVLANQPARCSVVSVASGIALHPKGIQMEFEQENVNTSLHPSPHLLPQTPPGRSFVQLVCFHDGCACLFGVHKRHLQQVLVWNLLLPQSCRSCSHVILNREIVVDGSTTRTRFGRIGTNGSVKVGFV